MLGFCIAIDSLMVVLDYEHITDELMLFIDSGKDSVKWVLLHNGNEKLYVPLSHARGMKDT